MLISLYSIADKVWIGHISTIKYDGIFGTMYNKWKKIVLSILKLSIILVKYQSYIAIKENMQIKQIPVIDCIIIFFFIDRVW